MKIEQLPSGSYRIRKMCNGTTYTVITDYKPTQKEALQLVAAELDKVKLKKTYKTFEDFAKEYMELKSNVLSPATIRGYNVILRNLPVSFTKARISDIDNTIIQRMVNTYSKTHAPKTVKNAVGFVSAVMSMYNSKFSLDVTLPQKIKKEVYVPTDEDVKRIFQYAKGTIYEAAIMLAAMGLRRSEICALTIDDLDGNYLTINKALVPDANNKFVIKTTKTTESTRTLYIPDDIVAVIRENGCIYKGTPNNILWFLYKAQKELGIPKFSLHKLRHYFATKLSYLPGINDEDILKLGGWKTTFVLKEVYSHSQIERNKKVQQDIANTFSYDLFS